MDAAAVAASLQAKLRDYVEKNHIKALVLGVSGGIDSALVAALARPVCDMVGIDLIGRSITISSNKPEEVARAAEVGLSFCTKFKEIDLGDEFPHLVKTLIEDDEPGDLTKDRKVRRGNLKARLRMVRLYDLASKNGGMVLSTDNFTELMLGFWTLHGDVGDYGMIQYLWKTEVYELARYVAATLRSDHRTDSALALESCIEAIATDGLGITSSDLEQLGADTYEEVDRILKIWLCRDEDSFFWDDVYNYEGRPEKYEDFFDERLKLKEHLVVVRHEASHFKRNSPVSHKRCIIKGLENDDI